MPRPKCYMEVLPICNWLTGFSKSSGHCGNIMPPIWYYQGYARAGLTEHWRAQVTGRKRGSRKNFQQSKFPSPVWEHFYQFHPNIQWR